MPDERRKVVILGGGLGAVSAAFELTNDPQWKRQFESITLYQIGWRLGGKGASGRNTEHYDRIEEHGLHVMLGFYENTFRIMREAYAELDRPSDAPLATWQQAFKPHNYVVLMDQGPKGYQPWSMPFPPNDRLPGESTRLAAPQELWERAVEHLTPHIDALHHQLPPDLPEHLLQRAIKPQLAGKALAPHPDVLSDIDRWLTWLWEVFESIALGQWGLRRMLLTLNMGVSFLRGYYADVVMHPDLDIHRLDVMDLRAWFKSHGAWDATLNSGYMNGLYNLAFAQKAGAGSAIVGFSRMLLDYAGAVFWKMQAGMGDVIFGPLYEVLKKRGVKFEFFSRVDELHMSADGLYVDRIEIGRQATLQDGVDEYDPLVPVKGLRCWPSTPKYALLKQGDALKASQQNLENWWTTWEDPVAPRVLSRGKDFDEVILGLSVASFPYVAKQVMDESPAFKTMVEGLSTTQTESAQLWLSRDLKELGWELPSPVLDGYAEPFDTWADMSALIERENYPAGSVKNIAYLTSSLADAEPLPPRSDHGYYERQRARVKADALAWLQTDVRPLWPKATAEDNPNGLDWTLLVDPDSPQQGPARFDSQYWVATANPSDRYVLSVPHSYFKRLRADESGVNNLYLAGDWLRTGLSLGCAEGAVMGGLQASQALSGRPRRIVGDENMGTRHPPYVQRGGDLVLNAPIRLLDTTLYSFTAPADYGALHAMLDRDLNHVPHDGLVYRPLLPMVSVVCANVDKSYSLYPPDRQKGWMPERDYSFWVPVVAGYEKGGTFEMVRLAWYQPYMFVDNVAAMLTGRETWGFHKQTAQLSSPSAPGEAGDFSVDTLFIERFEPDAEGKVGRLVTVSPTLSEPAPQSSSWSEPAQLLEPVLAALREHLVPDDLSTLPLPSWELLESALTELLTGQVPMVFLKQFHDARYDARACYRALVEAPSRLVAFKGGGLLAPHRVTLTPAASHPIARDLGLPASPFLAPLCMWTKIDFDLLHGTVVAGEE